MRENEVNVVIEHIIHCVLYDNIIVVLLKLRLLPSPMAHTIRTGAQRGHR